MRKVDLQNGKVLKQVEVPSGYFAEGLTVLGSNIFQLTWQNEKGFVYDAQSFQSQGEFAYTGEGWGLTTDGQWLILNDGTHQIRFLDPLPFPLHPTISLFHQRHPLPPLTHFKHVK